MSFALHEAMRIGALCLSVPAFSVPSKGEKRKEKGWMDGEGGREGGKNGLLCVSFWALVGIPVEQVNKRGS